ncbi:MAG: polynucleotide adenylyltransferase, partial [Chloroflexi bacterium]|nr:polynucleotide adenylyltransferase [Chloroflexota bacterium]
MASLILRRLRLSGRASNLIETVIEHHLRPGQMSHGTELATPRAVYRYLRSAGDAAVDTLYLNLADYLAARGPRLERDEWSDYAAMVGHILHTSSVQEEAPPPRLVDGHDLMRALGLDPGPELGRVLELIAEARAAGEISTKDEALALARDALVPEKEEHRA